MSADPRKLYQAFDPRPLTAGEQTELYVDLSAVRGEDEVGGVAKYLADHMRLAQGPTCQLLTGQRGSGKSTELNRLKGLLSADSEKIYTVICDIDELLDRNDLDFPDLLLAIIRQLAQQLSKDLHITLKPAYFSDRFNELRNLLGAEIVPERLELETGLVTIVGTIKASPIWRAKIREALELKADSLLHAANDVIAQATQEVKQKGFAGLAILVDNTDHLVRRTGQQAEHLPGESLFIRRHPQVSALDCHVVYAVPLALAMSVRNRDLLSLYGRKTPVLGLTKLCDPNGTPFDAGMNKFREMIQKRVAFAGASLRDLLADDTVRDDVIRLSGGQPLELCAIIRDALVRELPIRKDAVAVVRREAQRAYNRWLERRHWEIIQKVRGGAQPIPDENNRDVLRDLLDGRALLYYRNDKEWVTVSPLVGPPPEGL